MYADTWKDCKNILCIRLDNMGDVLMTEPAIRALKEADPDRKITLLTSTVGSLIAPHIPSVDEVMTFDVPWVKSAPEAGEQQLITLAEQLRGRQFDAACIFTVYSQNPLPTAMLCYLAGIKNVLGYCRENPYQLIPQWVPDDEPLKGFSHEVERQLALVGQAGAATKSTNMQLAITDKQRTAAREELIRKGVDLNSKWLILHPGVSEDKRRYPFGDYLAACKELAVQGYQIVLTGSGNERNYAQSFADEIGDAAVNLAGELSVTQLCATIAEAPLLVSNNTGPVHIAAATGTPVVVLYAMTNPQHTPWQVPNRVLYFDVPPELRSKNRLLQTFPGPTEPKASPEAIVTAVAELMNERT